MRWFAAHALLPGGAARDVLFEVEDGRFRAVTPGAEAGDATRLPGVVVPGFANAHSHAFHRALRGRVPPAQGDFWTWREAMYRVAGALTPDSYLDLARATYAEMALAGITTVGEFHYLHHAPGGRRYADPNVMADALQTAAAQAGVRLTLLDTCYLAGGLGADGPEPLTGPQLRFGDGDADAWAERMTAVGEAPHLRVGAAIHSVRAVPEHALQTVARAAGERPLHLHLSEQPAENEACMRAYGRTPTRLVHDHGVLGPRTTVVHATHLSAPDIVLLGASHTTACLCPTTERDLGDGIGPARALLDAGCPLSLGSDQHTVIDLLEEARAMEMHERLATGRRNRFTAAELLTAATAHDSLGWPDAGRLEAGARADLVAVRLDTVRTAGSPPATALSNASAADVDTVIVDGEVVVAGGAHRLGDVGRLLTTAVDALWAPA